MTTETRRQPSSAQPSSAQRIHQRLLAAAPLSEALGTTTNGPHDQHDQEA